MWHKEAFCYESHVMSKGFIVVAGQHLKTTHRCVIVNVYSACALRDKKQLWEEITNIKAVSQVSIWSICGDFNAIRSRRERKGASSRSDTSSGYSSEIDGFNRFIESNLLLDLPIVGKKYTWFKANGSAKSRLDRSLVSEEWLNIWPMCKQYVQWREVFDHCALVVKTLDKDWGPKLFRTIDAWHMERGFSEMVKEKWKSFSVQGDGITNLKDKLKMLKGELKIWNKEVYGNLYTTKECILRDIESFDRQDLNGGQDDRGRMERMELLNCLKEVDRKIDSFICQKARVSWFKYGDSSTKFYHSSLRWRRRRNEVKGVVVGDQWCEEPCTVRAEAKKVFENRFKATRDFGVRLDEVEFRTLSPEDNECLIASFRVEEVKEVVWQCEGAKSPGPDGFNFNFIRKRWEFIKEDIVNVMALFHDIGVVPKGCNASFVALIPKVKDPSKLEQYRPISLVGVIYKVIAKVLAGRIKKVINSVVEESQSAFLKGSGILDSVLMANEALEDLKRGGKSGLCLKVDFEKAYDSVRWDFLYDMLYKLGFHNKWIMWMRGCMESSTVSVLVNGSPTEEFKPTKGLRQGDPLAPFLFIVVAEGLAGLVRQATKASMLSGVKIGRGEVELCILQFADDTLFLCEESHSNVVTLKAILRGFEIASGLKVNFHKSKISGVNVGGNAVASYAKMMNCAQMKVPFKYLGLEVGGNPRTVKFWVLVLTKLKARLNGWRGRFLSLAGRISLVKTVISSVPLYYLSIFKAPESIYKNIISIQRRFLWGWGKEKRPIQWVSWEDVCKSKEDGGLGIRDIRKFNLALLAKWRWRLVSNEEGRWKDLLASKYGMVTVLVVERPPKSM